MARSLNPEKRRPVAAVDVDQMGKDIEDNFRKRMDTADALKMNKRIDDKQHREMVVKATDERRIANLRLNQQRRKAAIQKAKPPERVPDAPASRPASRPSR